MGTCCSTGKDSGAGAGDAKARSFNGAHSQLSCRDPPPDPEAEETVKEVLSETPRPRFIAAKPKDDAFKPSKVKNINGDFGLFVPVNGGAIGGGAAFFDDKSEAASESYSASVISHSDALSASTTATGTAPETRGAIDPATGEAPERKRRDLERSPVSKPAAHQRKRSMSGDFTCRRDRSVAVGCGAGRSSPVRKTASGGAAAVAPEVAGVARTHSARETNPAPRRLLSGGAKREPGNRSGRRSVSPAAKRAAELRQSGGVAVGGQCRVLSSSRVDGRSSPHRIQVEGSERNVGVVDREATMSTMTDANTGDTAAESSLDNPLVSLECFIFL